MKISLLVLHVVCAIMFSVCAIINTNIVASILFTISSVLWGVVVGMDISKLIIGNE